MSDQKSTTKAGAKSRKIVLDTIYNLTTIMSMPNPITLYIKQCIPRDINI